ncbi:MFS transporter [Paenibacillus sp. FSL R5-0766]|uniref:MFS transporter n=1 Tax=unclassified Paenibacillus TaxID=185978 RepID=UPI00096F4657|nr:MFS transporter [Paenibacillus sp. FSL R5-0765]OMF64219.1 antiporter [Paenibacillus sp. FSL R5-0765]
MNTKAATTNETGPLLLRVLVFTLIISVMNGTMFNVVLPVISKEFQLTASQVTWIVSGYLIVYAIGTVTYGKLTDKFSIKSLITFGLLLLTVGSLVGVVATQYWMIIVARILQAAGAAVIPALAMIIPVRFFSPEKRGRALGTSAIGTALGAALGPIIAGFVSSALNWKFLFVIPLLSLITLPLYRKYLDDEPVTNEKIDYIGGILLAGTVATFLLALTQSNMWLLVTGLVILVLFIIRIRYASVPFVNPAIFKNKQYSIGMAIAFVLVAVGFGIPFLTPLMLSDVNGLSPASIGLIMLPSALITAILGRKGGKLADEKGNPFLLYIASTLLAGGFIILSSVVGMSPTYIQIFLTLGVLGQSYIQIAMSNTISRTLPKDEVGIGMGLLSMFNFIAAAVSTTAIGKLLDGGATTVHFNPFVHDKVAFVYSNILLALALIVVVIAVLYALQFGRKSNNK